MVATTFLYIIIILCYVNKLNNSMSNFGGRLGQPKKMNLILGHFFFFCQHNSTGGGFLILKQIISILLRTIILKNFQMSNVTAHISHILRSVILNKVNFRV
jgi:hypothetical protein